MDETLLAFVSGTWHSFAGVSVWALSVALALHVVKMAAEARSWHEIVNHVYRTVPVPFRTTFGAFVGAIGANAILPARVGEALRVGIVRRGVEGSSVVTIAATIALETTLESPGAKEGTTVPVKLHVGNFVLPSTATLTSISINENPALRDREAIRP